jgi:hypothetical protein
MKQQLKRKEKITEKKREMITQKIDSASEQVRDTHTPRARAKQTNERRRVFATNRCCFYLFRRFDCSDNNTTHHAQQNKKNEREFEDIQKEKRTLAVFVGERETKQRDTERRRNRKEKQAGGMWVGVKQHLVGWIGSKNLIFQRREAQEEKRFRSARHGCGGRAARPWA